MTDKPQTPDAVEVMAEAIRKAINTRKLLDKACNAVCLNPRIEENGIVREAIYAVSRDLAQAALAVDPLRQKLGPKAVEAILNGWGEVHLDLTKHFEIEAPKGIMAGMEKRLLESLTQPANQSPDARNMVSDHTEDMLDMVGDHIGDTNDMMPAKGDDTNSPLSIVSDEQCIQSAKGYDAFKKPETLNTLSEHAHGVNISTEGEGI